MVDISPTNQRKAPEEKPSEVLGDDQVAEWRSAKTWRVPTFLSQLDLLQEPKSVSQQA